MKMHPVLYKIVLLFLVLHNSTVLKAQSTVLGNGVIVSNGLTYDVRISNNHNFISVEDNSVFDKEQRLNNNDKVVINFPEGLIKINKEKLLEIKRKFYSKSQNEVKIRISINVNDSKLLGLEYTLPKNPIITKDQFKAFDAQIRKDISLQLVLNSFTADKSKFNGWVSTSVILK